MPLETPSNLGEMSEEQLRAMPLEQLEQQVLAKVAGLQQAPEREGLTDYMDDMPPPPPDVAPGLDEFDQALLPPELVQAASGALVELGLLPAPTDVVTLELLSVLQGALDKVSPGMYNLQEPDTLTEVINELAQRGPLFGELRGGAAGERGSLPEQRVQGVSGHDTGRRRWAQPA